MCTTLVVEHETGDIEPFPPGERELRVLAVQGPRVTTDMVLVEKVQSFSPYNQWKNLEA